MLSNWWLERVEGKVGKIRVAGIDQMRKGASSSKGISKGPAREFRSATIVKRNDFTDLETEDGFLIKLRATLNKPRTLENGFDEKVCDCFDFGFPIQWEELTNPVVEPENDHAPTANASAHSVEYYMKLFSSEEYLSNPMNYVCINLPGFNSSSGCDQHESIQIDTSEQGRVNQSIRSVPLGQSTCTVCSNSKVDGNISASSKVVSVEKEGNTSRYGCGQAEQDAGIRHTNMDYCSTEQKLATLCIHGTQSRAVGDPEPEDNPVRRLRSGKVFGIPSSDSMKTGHKCKRLQHEASNKKMVPNEGATPTADHIHNKDSSAAGTVAEDMHQLHDPQRKGPGTPAKKRDRIKEAKQRRANSKLFFNPF